MTDQKQLWESKWMGNGKVLPPSEFAEKAYELIFSNGLKTVLDLGCGNGNDSLFFGKKGLDVTALDWSESAVLRVKELAKAKKILNLKTSTQSIDQLSFPANSFDVIYAHLSLHYFSDQKTTEIFNQLFSILKPGGLLFVKCKSVDDAYYGRGEKIEDDMFSDDGHIRHFFSKKYMNDKLSRFAIIELLETSSVYVNYKSNFIEAIARKA